jgi:hypothetical protein
MTPLLLFKNKIGPRQFSHGCLLLSALWLIIIYPGMIWLCPNKLPREMITNKSHYDFVQYYIGAEVVKHDIWDALYPQPKIDIYANPPHLTPLFKTVLFDSRAINGNPAFYPAVNLPEASDVSPKLIACLPQAASTWRFIYPPPSALLLWPLSFTSLDFAGGRLWPMICLWSYFVLSLCASRIHRMLRQSPSYTEGLIVLACLLFTYRGRTDLNSGNITPILSALIAFSVYALMQRRLFAFSCSLVPLILFKMLGLTWLPLLILNRTYWRVLLYLALITLFLNGIVIGLAGIGVYEAFFSLSSKIIVPAGFGIVPSLLHLLGFCPQTLYLIIDLVCLGFLYYGYGKRAMGGLFKHPVDGSPLFLVALLAGAMALYCLTNFSVWFTYCPNYLFFPFMGWILYEGCLASGYWRHLILGGTGLAFLVLAGEWVVKGGLFYLFGKASVDWYQNLIFQPSCILFIPAFFLLVALRRLLSTVPSQNKLVK